MIRKVGAMAGLHFAEVAADNIASCCSDMPFWIRKACSFIHLRTDTAKRPMNVSAKDIEADLREFVRDEGSALAQVALQHLFRVYPEIKEPAIKIVNGKSSEVSPNSMRLLARYGLASAQGNVSGEMVRAGLSSIETEPDTSVVFTQIEHSAQETLSLAFDDWAEELQVISRRRNVIEKRLREIVVNFLKFSALSSTDKKSAKERILATLPEKRRAEVGNLGVDELSQKLFWLELGGLIRKEWPLFEKIFGDQDAFRQNVALVNDRPDTHAKSIDRADVALYRRSLVWFEDKLARLS